MNINTLNTTVPMNQPVLEDQTVIYDLDDMADPAFTCSSASSTDSTLNTGLEPDDLDIKMWLQLKSSTDIKAEFNENEPDRALMVEENVSSPESLEEIPYSANRHDNQFLPLDGDEITNSRDTITVPAQESRSSTLHVPLGIVFMEGDRDELEIFPPHLYEQLVIHCRMAKTDYPDFIKSRWPRPDALCHTRTGLRAWFEASSTQEVLIQARYLYNKRGQIVVVKPRAGSLFNGGKAAIIEIRNGINRVTTRDGKTVKQYQWQVWNPRVAAHACETVWRCMAEGSTPEKSHSRKTPRQDFDIANLADTEFSQSHDVGRQLKRKPSTDKLEGDNKKSRPTTVYINASLLKAAYPINGTLGARRDAATGEMLITRKSDGKLVTLRCSVCDNDTCQTQQGLLNHLAIVHGVNLPDRDAVVDHCGILVDKYREHGAGSKGYEIATPKPVPHPTSFKFLKPRTIDDSTQSPALPTTSPLPTTRRVSQRLLATPPPSVAPSEPAQDPEVQPRFVFMKSSDDPNPRIRPLTTINTAEKLFVNALVAGVARKDTLMLTITVDKQTRFIVKDDKEDFETILELVKRSKHKNADIVVTVDDID